MLLIRCRCAMTTRVANPLGLYLRNIPHGCPKSHLFNYFTYNLEGIQSISIETEGTVSSGRMAVAFVNFAQDTLAF